MALRLVGRGNDAGGSYTDVEEASGRPMTAGEIADLEEHLAERKREAAALVATAEIEIQFSPVENDPSVLARVEVDMPYPISMGLSGIILRRWAPEERESLGPGAPTVCVVFGRPETAADELLDRAVAPKILRAWEQHENQRARARIRSVK